MRHGQMAQGGVPAAEKMVTQRGHFAKAGGSLRVHQKATEGKGGTFFDLPIHQFPCEKQVLRRKRRGYFHCGGQGGFA